MAKETKPTKNARKLTGVVEKLSGDKTVKVNTERKFPHPKYGKIVKFNKKYLVHNELDVKVGDVVNIEEFKPVSKRKTWKVVEIVKSL